MHIHYFRLYNLPFLLTRYYEAWELIHFPEKFQHNHVKMKQRNLTIWTVKCICVLTMIRTAQMAISMTVKMRIFCRMIYWDQMLFQNAIPQLNLIYVIITPFCVFYYYRMYFYENKKFSGVDGRFQIVWLTKLALESGEPRISHQDAVMKIDPEKVQKLVKKLLQLLQYYNLYFELCYVYYLYRILVYIHENATYFFTTLTGFFSILAIWANGLIAFLYIYLMMMEYILITTIGLITTFIIFSRFKSINLCLDRIQKNPFLFNSRYLSRFFRLHTLILLDIFEMNRLFGPILFSFIIGAVPTSAYQIVLILTTNLSRMSLVNFCNLALYQIGVIFGFHLAAAMYTSHIHKCRKKLIQISARKARCRLSVGARMKLALYAEKFNCKKRYGITYMGYGLISFYSFFKFTLLYGQLLMYSYQWIRRTSRLASLAGILD